MNFEQPQADSNPSKKEESAHTSRRAFLKTAFGFAVSSALAKGIVEVLPSWEDVAEEKTEPRLIRVKEPILADDEFVEDEGEEVEAPTVEEDIEKEFRELIDWKELKRIKPDLKYQEIVAPLQIENLRLPDDVGKYGASTHFGKILRTLRYKNITDAVEERYNLPSGILLAMIMEESTGVDLLPNARGDGGFGLCHMQGSTAREYGLKTFHECNSLVCDGKDSRSCKDIHGTVQDHASELTSYIKRNSQDRKKLVEADERLNILLNIDAAGRMLATGISGPKLKGKLSDIGPLRTAIARYAGAYNYPEYWKDICSNMKDFEDAEVLQKIESEFNQKNSSLKINGEKADFKKYVEAFQSEHANYGLEEYKKLTKYLPKNSARVMRTYREDLT